MIVFGGRNCQTKNMRGNKISKTFKNVYLKNKKKIEIKNSYNNIIKN